MKSFSVSAVAERDAHMGRGLCGRPAFRGRIKPSLWGRGRMSTHLFPRPKRGLRAEECAALCRSPKRKIILKRGLSAEPALFLYQTRLSTAALRWSCFQHALYDELQACEMQMSPWGELERLCAVGLPIIMIDVWPALGLGLANTSNKHHIFLMICCRYIKLSNSVII